jgi:heme A synthase
MTWPPRDTDRNRFLARLQVVLYGFVTVYFGLFALKTGAPLPWTVFTLALAATLVAAVALLMMRAQRQAAAQDENARHENDRNENDQQPAR